MLADATPRPAPVLLTPRDRRERLAWAAGFIDGEGYFSVRRGGSKSGLAVYAKLTIVQADDALGEPAEALLRLREALGVIPVISALYRHGRATPAHRGSHVLAIIGYVRVQAVVAALWPWLGVVKQAQARDVLLISVAHLRRNRLAA